MTRGGIACGGSALRKSKAGIERVEDRDTHFPVYQGTVKKDPQLFVDDGKKPFKVAQLFKFKGKDHVEIERAVPGDIAAVAKIDELHFDAVLHDSHDEDQGRKAHKLL